MSEPSRQLAAIMFTDIVGYTSLMGTDEKRAVTLLEQNRELHKRCIKTYKGKFLKEMGDGILARFPTISDAVYCSGSIQKEAAQTDGLNLRIGIHQGEILMQGGDIYGDGVNIASRIERLAGSGQILVSEGVYNNIRNRSGITCQFEGEHELKNVDRPVKVYALTVDQFPEQLAAKKSPIYRNVLIGAGIAILLLAYVFIARPFDGIYESDSSDKSTAIKAERFDKSIAVLPFADMSPNKDQEYLGDGIAEEILNVLSKIGELKVIGRTSSFSYKGKNTDLRTIGQELGVGTILEGSVRKDENLIRITAQLINAVDGSHIWSDSYEYELRNIFKIQDDLAQSVVQALFSSLNLIETEIKNSDYSINENAYDLYLLGKHYRVNFTNRGEVKKNVPIAIELLNSSIELDSSFSSAYTELSMLYSHLGFLYGEWEDQDVWKLAEIYADKALELDETNSEALRQIGYIRRTKYWDWEGARNYYLRSLDATPNNSEALSHYALLLSAVNQQDSAIVSARKALELNPTSELSIGTMIRTFYYARKYEDAIQYYEMQKQPTLVSNIFYPSILFQTDKDNAVSAMLDLATIDLTEKKELQVIYQNLGWKSLMENLYERLSENKIENANWFGNSNILILIHGAPMDVVFEKLVTGVRDKVGLLVYFLADPVFDPIRSDPRFDELLQMMGLDRYK